MFRDRLSLKVLLALPSKALHVLAEAIDLSFLKGCFPYCLKKAVGVPLFKGGNHNNPLNFRRMVLLPPLAKIVGRLVKVRMVSFLDRYNFISLQQFAAGNFFFRNRVMPFLHFWSVCILIWMQGSYVIYWKPSRGSRNPAVEVSRLWILGDSCGMVSFLLVRMSSDSCV